MRQWLTVVLAISGVAAHLLVPSAARASESAIPGLQNDLYDNGQIQCPACVDLGGGWGLVPNSNGACEPDCLGARIVSPDGSSDFMPIGRRRSSTSNDTAAPAGTSPGSGPAPSRPAPPSLAEAVATCPALPAPVIGRNPQAEGVTGLETYLWAAAHPPASSTATIRGYPVTCTITPVRWTWTSGDGAAYTRGRPGGPHPDHPVEHVYETKGDYELGLSVVWRQTTSHGTTETVARHSELYHVFEVRSVLTG